MYFPSVMEAILVFNNYTGDKLHAFVHGGRGIRTRTHATSAMNKSMNYIYGMVVKTSVASIT